MWSKSETSMELDDHPRQSPEWVGVRFARKWHIEPRQLW
ncbi:hypothetical protein MINT15_35660 [Saccharomonospora viridis]|uniref:Uncharacterized protein n=1 Tax=Saccharomonospora viridis TaxID=1852 RepID=A0A837DAE3_9PSEU|nr:hypothetical protein MINT15_35660 [Saccharomonospora viridis]